MMTKAQVVEKMMSVAEIMAVPEFAEYLQLEKVALEKRAAKGSQPSAETLAKREKFKDGILEAIAGGGSFTATEFTKLPTMDGASTQMLTPILTALVEEGLVVKTVVKRVGRYSAPKAE